MPINLVSIVFRPGKTIVLPMSTYYTYLCFIFQQNEYKYTVFYSLFLSVFVFSQTLVGFIALFGMILGSCKHFICSFRKDGR